MDSKKYSNTKLTISILESILSFSLLLMFVWSGLSTLLKHFIANSIFSNEYLIFLGFVLIAGICLSVITYPFSFYSGFYLEHKYNLSNQTFWQWTWENLKGTLIGGAIGLPLLLLFYYLIRTTGTNWWLFFAVTLFLFSIVLARIVPIFILPLFYKITPFENENLREKITNHAVQAGIKVDNIFQFSMSKNTKKANAAFTGIGKSKRILLGDNLVSNYSDDEIEAIIAHELGHYKKKHIIKNLIIGTISTFGILFLINFFYQQSLTWFGFKEFADIAAFPLLIVFSMIISLFLTPISSLISRKYEYEADKYAVDTTGKKEEFKSALLKLTEQNLGDKDPHPLVEWFFYSHPSIKNRINAIDHL